MIYVFVDETYPAKDTVRFSCIAVRQDYFNTSWREVVTIARSGQRNRDALILEYLTEKDFRTIITDLDMAKSLSPLGIPDILDRRGIISPRDDLWTHAFGYSVAFAVRFACIAWLFTVVDIHHDPKSLYSKLEEVFKANLREVVTKLSTEEVSSLQPDFRRRVRVRRIDPVSKTAGPAGFTKWQNGTWLAHCATRLPNPHQLDTSESKFLYRDLTPILMDVVEQTKGDWLTDSAESSIV
jgi:hypothetical protein